MKRIIIILFFCNYLNGMQQPLPLSTKQEILKHIKARNESELQKLIISQKITAIDHEVAIAANEEYSAYKMQRKPGDPALCSPAGAILIIINNLASNESKLPFSEQGVVGIPEDMENEEDIQGEK